MLPDSALQAIGSADSPNEARRVLQEELAAQKATVDEESQDEFSVLRPEHDGE